MDAAITRHPDSFIEVFEQFEEDARIGSLCAFSEMEPTWIAKVGTTPYLPGADLVPSVRALSEIYKALKAGLACLETL